MIHRRAAVAGLVLAAGLALTGCQQASDAVGSAVGSVGDSARTALETAAAKALPDIDPAARTQVEAAVRSAGAARTTARRVVDNPGTKLDAGERASLRRTRTQLTQAERELQRQADGAGGVAATALNAVRDQLANLRRTIDKALAKG